MLKGKSTVFKRLLDHINEMPVVDCHEHLRGPDRDLELWSTEPILALTPLYFISDLWSAGATEQEIALLQSAEASTEEKWPVFKRLWEATEHTAYARVTKIVLRKVYGVNTLDRNALHTVADRLRSRDRSDYMRGLQDVGIRAVIADVLVPPIWERHMRYVGNPVLDDFLSGVFEMPSIWHPAFSLPYFHEIRFREFVDAVGAMAARHITCLREYEEAVFGLIKRAKELGVVSLKDQAAYRRDLTYELPPRSEAEKCFNLLMKDPRSQLSWPEAKPLDDYLFHQFMRFARDLQLPVQVHTGHLAGIRNRVEKANAAKFAAVLELHQEVKFDLFHGNWPYLGDLLFLGKNYPNVMLDLCWVHMIDPFYTRELIKRAVTTMPHTKVFGFGGDYYLAPEFSAAHLSVAREVIASALSDLIECGWLEEDQAVRIAAGFLYNNPNEFYGLGLQPLDI